MGERAISRIENEANFENEDFLKYLDEVQGWALPLAGSLSAGLLSVEKALDANVRSDVSEIMKRDRNKLLAMQKVVIRFGKDRCEGMKSVLAKRESTLNSELSALSSEISKIDRETEEMKNCMKTMISKMFALMTRSWGNASIMNAMQEAASEAAGGDELMEAGVIMQILKSGPARENMSIEEVCKQLQRKIIEHERDLGAKMEEKNRKEEDFTKTIKEKDAVVSELAGMLAVGAALQEMGLAIGGLIKNEERARSLRRRLKEKVNGRIMTDSIVHAAEVYEKYRM